MDVHRRAWLFRLAAGLIVPMALVQEAVGQDGSRRLVDVRIEGRRVVAPKDAIRVLEDEVIELRWLSDEAVKLHLHGYDQELQLRPGEIATMSITAHATGRFPITSHGWGSRGHGHDALTHLEVHPR